MERTWFSIYTSNLCNSCVCFYSKKNCSYLYKCLCAKVLSLSGLATVKLVYNQSKILFLQFDYNEWRISRCRKREIKNRQVENLASRGLPCFNSLSRYRNNPSWAGIISILSAILSKSRINEHPSQPKRMVGTKLQNSCKTKQITSCLTNVTSKFGKIPTIRF